MLCITFSRLVSRIMKVEMNRILFTSAFDQVKYAKNPINKMNMSPTYCQMFYSLLALSDRWGLAN